MAKNKKADEYTVEENTVEVKENTYKPLNLDEQVTVRSIAGWRTGFRRLLSLGEVSIPPRGVIRLTRNEIITQVQNGNKLFTGYGENLGDHATLIIEDKATLHELGMENAKTFSEDTVKEIFAITGISKFNDALEKSIFTRAEMYASMVVIAKLNLNDYSKIRAFEEHTGYKLDKIKEELRNTR